jgi:frataxin
MKGLPITVYHVCSGPARFDWDAASNSWVYRRTGVNLMRLLEEEIGELCGTPVDLS